MVLKVKGQSWSNFIDWFFSCVKIFNQCEWNFSINVSEKFQSMLENFPSMWAKNFNQWAENFSRYRKNRHKAIFNDYQSYFFINYTNLIFRTFVHTKTKKRNWKKERFFIVLITKWLWLFRFLSKGKKQEKGEKRKKSKVCIFLL